jgi:hypothetical protein
MSAESALDVPHAYITPPLEKLGEVSEKSQG